MEPPTTPPRLEIILPRSTSTSPSTHTFLPPTKLINEGPDVERFLTSKAYRDICTFVLQLNRALVPRKNPQTGTQTFTLTSPRNDPPIVKSLQELLGKVEAIIGEAPPDPGPRRFGNVSFRRWHGLLEERVGGLLREYLPGDVLGVGEGEAGEEGDEAAGASAMTELKAYFIGGFGSAQRLDYGTGHELSFVAFLGCLWKLGAFEVGLGETNEIGEVERSIVLGVFEPYLNVIRRLILEYTLEPAGSHGVWGLDDHFFLPYIFGSAQLTRPITESEPTPLEGSCPGAPKPTDIVKPNQVEALRDQNMYFSAVGFINDVKKGPFWEHSPILFDVSGIKDGWGKINKGMVKMFNAEVLSKFPVVQHFPFGSLFSWDRDPNAAAPVTSVHMANQPVASAASASGEGTSTRITAATLLARAPSNAAAFDTVGGVATTTAPWARAPPQVGGGITYARVPRPGASAVPVGAFTLPPSTRVGGDTMAAPSSVPIPRGGAPDTGPPPPTSFPRGTPGQANNQFAVTKAPWAKD